jgi:predicted RNA-binding protein YlxR (DUF448 family)
MPAGKRLHTPVRMCAVCRRRFPKACLARHTRNPQGDWMPDADQTRPGRGRYLCSDPGCRERFTRTGTKGPGNKKSASGRHQG